MKQFEASSHGLVLYWNIWISFASNFVQVMVLQSLKSWKLIGEFESKLVIEKKFQNLLSFEWINKGAFDRYSSKIINGFYWLKFTGIDPFDAFDKI